MGQRGKYATIGARIGIGSRGQLVKRQGASYLDLSRPCVDATIDLAAPVSTARQILITLRDDEGDPINYVETVECVMFLNAARTAFAVTGGSTGIAIGSGGNGALLAALAKKIFYLTSEDTGLIDLVWTDDASEVAFIGLRLPNGRMVMSAALTI